MKCSKPMVHRTYMRILCLFLLAVMAPGFVFAEEQTQDAEPDAYAINYMRIVDCWAKSLENTSADIVFMGDSITRAGLWEEYYPDQMIVNLGVVGDGVSGLVMRLPLIEALLPSKCFVMAGVNNLAYGEPMDEILACYDQLLAGLDAFRQDYGLMVYIQSVLPVNEKVCGYGLTNANIQTLNEGIRALAEAYDMPYIDVYPIMLDENGMPHETYTIDGLHLTDSAYQAWQELLAPYVNE